MPQKRRPVPGSDPLPNPLKVSGRYAAVTGQREANPAFYPDALDLTGGYTTTGKGQEVAGVVLEADHRVIINSATSPIGQFDPAAGRWLFYPEYVDRRGHRPLSKHFDQALVPEARAMIAARRLLGQFVIDTYHPVTRNVRSEVARHLARLSPNLWERDSIRAQLDTKAVEPTPVVRADEYTVATLALGALTEITIDREPVGLDDVVTTATISPTGVPGQGVVLCYNGILVQHPDFPQGTMRDTRYVKIAERDPERPDIWIPDLDLVTPDEWRDAFLPAADALDRASVTEPNFSSMHSAVAYHPQSLRGDDAVIL